MQLAVAMCTRNGQAHVGVQLASILEQTHPPDSVVVCDDASDDRTVTVLQQVAGPSAISVSVVQNPVQLGIVANFEQAIGLAQGDVIALADQDDVWVSTKLERLAEVFADETVTAAFSDGTLIDGAGRTRPGTLWGAVGFGSSQRRRVRRGHTLDVLLRRNAVTGAALAFRSSLREVALPLPPHLQHDYALALVAATTGRLVAVDEPLIAYRLHDGNQVGVPPVGLRARADRYRDDASVRREELGLMTAILERVAPAGASSAAISALGAKIRFLEDRLALPPDRRTRVTPVLRATGRGRYHRYASGFRSAAHDIAFGT